MQHSEYDVDVVMVIDSTGSMGSTIGTVQNGALKFDKDLKAALDTKGKVVHKFRVGVLAFRDLNCDGKDSMKDSGFFTLPADQDAFTRFVQGLSASGGGDEPESGLEAVDLAIQSDWTSEGTKRRHIIVVWSDASTHPIGAHGADANSGFRFAKSFDELTDRWHADGRLSKTSKRLILFTPDAAGWTEIATNWENVVHFPSKAGEGLSEVDYNTILDAIQNSI